MIFKNISECLASISTMLFENTIIHSKCRNATLTNGYRGLSRFHKEMSKNNFCDAEKYNQYLADNHKLVLEVNKVKVSVALDFSISDLPKHLELIVEKYTEDISFLRESLAFINSQNHFSIYKLVYNFLECYENQLLYINIMRSRFEKTEYSAHDVAIVMCKLHKYFENEYETNTKINFDI